MPKYIFCNDTTHPVESSTLNIEHAMLAFTTHSTEIFQQRCRDSKISTFYLRAPILSGAYADLPDENFNSTPPMTYAVTNVATMLPNTTSGLRMLTMNGTS